MNLRILRKFSESLAEFQNLLYKFGRTCLGKCGTAGCGACTASKRFSSWRQLPVRPALHAQTPTLYEYVCQYTAFRRVFQAC